MCADHGKLLKNTFRWALNEEPMVDVRGPGVLDVTTWRQEHSITIHLVNLTNPMMMKGPFRELIPVNADVSIKMPMASKVGGVHLLVSGQEPVIETNGDRVKLKVPQIYDHEIIGIDLM